MRITHSSVLALDVGDKRIGVAIASQEARLPQPLSTLPNDDIFTEKLQQLIHKYTAQTIVVGLPRNLSGEDTLQTAYVRQFVEQLQQNIDTPFVWQDEATTSLKAENELKHRGKRYTKEDIDALSATYILEDYLGGITN